MCSERCEHFTICRTHADALGISFALAIRVAINFGITVSVRITFCDDVESVLTNSERIKFRTGFRFAVTDTR